MKEFYTKVTVITILFSLLVCLTIPLAVVVAATIADVDHETGDLSQYDNTVTNGGDLSVTAGAAIIDSYGLSALVSYTDIYAEKNITLSTDTIRMRAYIDPNGLSMTNGDSLIWMRIRSTYGGGNAASYYLEYNGGYRIVGGAIEDGGSNNTTAQYTITDAPHYIECRLVRATNATSNDGTFDLWIDGVWQEQITGLDTYYIFNQIYRIRLGALGRDAGTSGTFYMDDLEANDDGTEIGPATTPTPTATPEPPPEPDRVSAYRDTNLSVATANWTTIIFNQELVDTNANYNPTTGILSGFSSGKFYLVCVFAVFSSSTAWTDSERMQLSVYGTSHGHSYIGFETGMNSGSQAGAGGCTVIQQSPGETWYIQVYQNSGSTLTLVGDVSYCWLRVQEVIAPALYQPTPTNTPTPTSTPTPTATPTETPTMEPITETINISILITNTTGISISRIPISGTLETTGYIWLPNWVTNFDQIGVIASLVIFALIGAVMKKPTLFIIAWVGMVITGIFSQSGVYWVYSTLAMIAVTVIYWFTRTGQQS